MRQNLPQSSQQRKTKLVVVATHPIQYQAPWFRELSKQISLDVSVIFGMMPNDEQQSIGFGTSFAWDIPLTDGYQWFCLENKSKNPNLSSFKGIDCPDIYRQLKIMSPDAVIITGWHSKLLLQTLWACRRLRIKTIIRGDSNAKKDRPFYVSVIHSLLLKRFDLFLSVGKSNTEFYLNNGIKPKTIFMAPHFIENQRFINKAGSNSTVELSNNGFCFIYAGKLIKKKNVSEIISAFNRCYAMNQNCQLLIIGNGELRSKLEAHAKNLPITFAGFINQQALPGVYRQGDCLVLASDFDETWGLVVNEAMACGLPAIVSKRAGCSDDLAIDHQTGFSYEFGDVKALSEKMLYMLENPKQAQKMGQNAKQHILDGYDVKHAVDGTIEALEYLGY